MASTSANDNAASRATTTAVRPVRNTEKGAQSLRLGIQSAFAALCIWIGVEFHFFVRFLESDGAATFVARPPGVDGFLPISSLMSLYYYLLSGEIHPYHPAGMFILLAILAVSLVFGKSFCSWLCPVGFLSEMIADFTQKLFGRTFMLPRWLDYPLRSVKYLLLAFFVWAIFLAMNQAALRMFLDSPYNLVSDIKMYYFFADISRFALIVVGVLFLLSLVVRGFWCRYLCPYGALLGFFSLIAPNRIVRNAESCIDCSACARVCPSRIKVDKVNTVVSDECTSCMACVDSCPIANTLQVQMRPTRRVIKTRWVALGVAGLFVLITGTAMISGHWHNDIPVDTYLQHQENVHSYGHPTGSRDINRLNRDAERRP